MASIQLMQYRNPKTNGRMTFLSVLMDCGDVVERITYFKHIIHRENEIEVIECSCMPWEEAVKKMHYYYEAGWEHEFDTAAYAVELTKETDSITAHFQRPAPDAGDEPDQVEFQFGFTRPFVFIKMGTDKIAVPLIHSLREIDLITHRGFSPHKQSHPSN